MLATAPSEFQPSDAPLPSQGEQQRLKSALERSAAALTADSAEAGALVAVVMGQAQDIWRAGGEVGLSQMFRMLRESYHSVARTRSRRPLRDATLTALVAAARRVPPPDGAAG
jgi:hypothetical protein